MRSYNHVPKHLGNIVEDRTKIMRLKMAMKKAKLPTIDLDDILDEQQSWNWIAACEWILRNSSGGGSWRRICETTIANHKKKLGISK